MEHTVTTKKWYVVTGTAGATVTSPDGSKTYCTIPEGGQGTFYATAPKVVTSDDSVEVVETTFNSAPVKLKLLGLLGGGVSTGLPSGYIAVDFLETSGTQTLRVDTPVDNEFGLYYDVMPTNASAADNFPISMQTNDGGYKNIRIVPHSKNASLIWWTGGSVNVPGKPAIYNKRVVWQGNYKNNRLLTTDSNFGHAESNITTDIGKVSDCFGIGRGMLISRGSFSKWIEAEYFKAYSVKLSRGSNITHDLSPAVDASGVPCMYDKVSKQPFYNSGTGSFIVGMTMEQARMLSKLPATGGTLTVSLPSNYLEDEGVVNALSTAQENNWKITIQTYEAEAGAASTFALRRIWVRKRTDEQGSYVDTDGFRWQVDWCVDVVGSSPEAEGYEPFRSVDVAVNYWNLQPWVDPEQEEISTNIKEQ